MKDSVLTLVDKLLVMLLQVSALVDSMERREYDYVDRLLRWLKATEDIFITHKIAEAAELAGFRSKILAARLSVDRSATSRRSQMKVASDNFYDIQHAVLAVFAVHKTKVDECRELVRQLLALLKQSGSVRYDATANFQAFIGAVWLELQSNAQLKHGTIKLGTLLPASDILRLLAEEVDLSVWPDGRAAVSQM